MNNSISVYSSDYVMNTQLERLKFIVYQMLYPGLYILAGVRRLENRSLHWIYVCRLQMENSS